MWSYLCCGSVNKYKSESVNMQVGVCRMCLVCGCMLEHVPFVVKCRDTGEEKKIKRGRKEIKE